MKTNVNLRNGFTLVELLLVVVIIGILASIVVPKLTGRAQEASIAAARDNIKLFKTALGMYEIDNQTLPSNEQGLIALIEKPSIPPEPRSWRPYLQQKMIPKDPWGNDYVYRYYTDEQGYPHYEIRSLGPDGQDGNADDIVE